MAEINKEQLANEFKELIAKFQKENPTAKQLITRDYYRKTTQHGRQYEKFFLTFNDLKEFALGGGKISKGFEVEKQILQLKDKVFELERDRTNLLKGRINEDRLLGLYVENLKTEIPIKIDNNPIIYEESKHRIGLLHISDAHLGEVVHSEDVNNVNEYNKDICIERLDTVFNVFMLYCKEFKIQKAHILLNGDLLSGGIHQELVRNSDLNEIEQLFVLQRYFIKKFEYMSQFFSRIDVDIIVGNHARILPGKPYYKEKVKMSFEYLFGMQLKMYFDILRNDNENSKIFIDVPEGAFKIVNLNGCRFLETHGDILTGAGAGGFAGIPFYSICANASKLYGILHQIELTRDVMFDNILCGHLHVTTKVPLFNGGFCYINGCIIGTNEFSLMKMKSVAKREQTMLVIDKSGRVELEKHISF